MKMRWGLTDTTWRCLLSNQDMLLIKSELKLGMTWLYDWCWGRLRALVHTPPFDLGVKMCSSVLPQMNIPFRMNMNTWDFLDILEIWTSRHGVYKTLISIIAAFFVTGSASRRCATAFEVEVAETLSWVWWKSSVPRSMDLILYECWVDSAFEKSYSDDHSIFWKHEIPCSVLTYVYN